jgi:hypothetical protein
MLMGEWSWFRVSILHKIKLGYFPIRFTSQVDLHLAASAHNSTFATIICSQGLDSVFSWIIGILLPLSKTWR